MSGKNLKKQVVSWENAAATAASAGNFQEAVRAHRQALVVAEELDRPRLAAVLYNRLGNALEADGQIQEAVVAYESGLRALAGEKGSGLEQVMDALRQTSKGYDPAQAREQVPDLYSETAAAGLDDAEAEPTLAVKLLINTGNAYLRQPQLGPALQAYGQALARPEIDQAPAQRAHALTHVGLIRRRQGDGPGARAALHEALALLEKVGERLDRRRALAALAGIERDEGQPDRALALYTEAQALYRQAGDTQGEGRVLAALGHLALAGQRPEEARQLFGRARDLAAQAGDGDTLWQADWGLGRCLHLAGELEEAAAALQRCLEQVRRRHDELRTDEGKVTFLESVQDIFDHLVEVYLDRARTEPGAYGQALETVEEARGQALQALMGDRRRRQLDSHHAGMRQARTRPWDERLDAARQMAPGAWAGGGRPNPAAQMAAGIPSPTSLRDLVAQMAPGVPSPGAGQGSAAQMAPGIESLPLLVEPGAEIPARAQVEAAPLARLVFHTLAERTAVFAVATSGAVAGHVAPLGRETLAGRVAALRAALRVDDRPRGLELERDARRRTEAAALADPQPLLRELYAALVEPLAGALPGDGAAVVVEPHGPLWLLPFAALQAADGRWLADLWPLLYSPSARVLDEIRTEPDYGGPGKLKALVVGNPALPQELEWQGGWLRLAPLPGAEEEAEAIHNLLAAGGGSTLLTGAAADWASVVERLPQHGIVHLASHGLADPDRPLDSFVALAAPAERRAGEQESPPEAGDGLLTARQVLDLPLPADLVALSACQTGLGRVAGEGMIGLSRSFLVAGARAVLVSQWSVSDAATAALMAAFYQGYVALDDKALALQRAMAVVRAMPEFADPRYWAPFVVVGAEA